MIQVFSTNEPSELEYARTLLERENIPLFIKNRDLRGAAAGEVPPLVAQAEVWVHQKDAESAAKILREVRMKLSVVKEPWQCSCGESLEGAFEVCWSCGTAREDLPA